MSLNIGISWQSHAMLKLTPKLIGDSLGIISKVCMELEDIYNLLVTYGVL